MPQNMQNIAIDWLTDWLLWKNGKHKNDHKLQCGEAYEFNDLITMTKNVQL